MDYKKLQWIKGINFNKVPKLQGKRFVRYGVRKMDKRLKGIKVLTTDTFKLIISSTLETYKRSVIT